MTRKPFIAVVLAAGLQVVGAQAADLQWAAEVGAAHTNNIARAPVNPQEEDIGQADLQLAATEQTRRLNADLAADLAYLDYFKNTYDSEFIGSLKGNLDLEVLPDRLRWLISDSFGQAKRDPFAAATPDNRENINYLTTGPDLALPLGTRDQAVLGARYSRIDYETSPFDSQRYLGSLTLGHDLAAGSAVSLEGSTERVDYSQSPSSAFNYDRRQAMLRYSLTNSRTTFVVGAGYNRIEQRTGSVAGSVLSLEWSHRISSRSVLSMEAGRELTDSGASYGSISQLTNVSLDAQSLSRTADPFQSSHIMVRWDATGRRTRLGASAAYYKESYLTQSQFDRDRTLGDVHFYRTLTQHLGVRVTGAIEKDDYRAVTGDSTDSTLEGGFSLQAGRRLTVDLSAQRYHRSSDLTVGDINENRYWLRVRYGEQFISGVGAFGQRIARRIPTGAATDPSLP